MFKIQSCLRSSLLAGAAVVTVFDPSSVARAQTASDIETVTVTGTRIPNRDFISDSPISTVSDITLKMSGSLSTDQLLNTLPQIVPGLTAASNNPPGNGQASIDLRGLGPNRTVVLINGRRASPSNSDGTVDLQTIPQPLISRIEIITGGASSVYGPDAVAGVVNFVLKDDFEGLEVNAQYGISDRGDNEEKSVSVLMGGNFANNRGNIVLSYDYAYRRPILDSARSFAAQASSATSYTPTGVYRPNAGNLPTDLSVASYFAANGGAPASAVSGSTFLGFNDDGSLFTLGSLGGASAVYNYKSDPAFPAQLFCADPSDPANCGAYSYNYQPPNLLILPLQRHNFMGLGRYRIWEDIEAYAQVGFTNYSSASSLAPSPAPTSSVTYVTTNGFTDNCGYNYCVPVDNPFIPAALKTILNTRTGDSAALDGSGATEDIQIRTRFLQLGARLSDVSNNLFSLVGGLRGTIPETNIHFDVFGQYGHLDILETQFGNVSNSAVEQLLFNQGNGTCTGWDGFNLFGANKMSAACAEYVQRITKNSTKTTQSIVEADFNGTLMPLPAGDIKWSLGASYREQTYDYLPDPLLISGDISGFNAQDPVSGAVYDKEVYAELYFPLFKDMPFVESASVTLGGRYTNHSITGDLYTYKAEGNWSIDWGLNFRGSYQHAVRAPNINELFASSFQDNPELKDPCDYDSAFLTGPDAAQVSALCMAQGVPDPTTFMQPNGQITAIAGGNPTVKAETANTFTVGLVWQSRESNPWIRNLSASLDYWNIDLKGPVGIDVAAILYGCFNADGSNPSYDAGNINCQKIIRSSGTGSISYISAFQTNLGFIHTSGLDLAVNWAIDLEDTVKTEPGWGSLMFNLSVTRLEDFSVKNGELAVPLQYVGTIGSASPVGINTDGAIPRWKGQLTATWNVSDFTFSGRANFISGMRNSAELVLGKGANFGIGPVTGTPAVWYFDLFGTYDINSHYALRGGILNVGDKQPPLYNPSQQDYTDPAAFDVIGRRYYIAATAKF